MRQLLRQPTLNLLPKSVIECRPEARTRTVAIPARLTDLYRDRIHVTVLKVSQSALGVKVDHPLFVNFPVLIECEGLLIIGNVRHCIKAAKGGYLLGMKIHKIVDTTDAGVQQDRADSHLGYRTPAMRAGVGHAGG